MHWVWPWQAALVGAALAVLLGGVAWRAQRRRQALARWLGGSSGLASVRAGGRRGVRLGLLLGGLVLVLIGLARPQGPVVLTGADVRGRVLVLLDLSASMGATDALPSRLETARQWLEGLVPQFPAARLGLIGFAGEAQVLCPPTEDHSLVLELIRDLPADLALREGSELHLALGLARSILEREGGGDVILVTDGEYHDPQPATALTPDGPIGLVTVTVGGATPVPVPADRAGDTVTDPRDGRPALSAARPEAMRVLARAVGGCAVAAGQPGAGLAEVVRYVGEHAARQPSAGVVPARSEVAAWVLALAVALLVGRLLVADRPSAAGMAAALPAGLLGVLLLCGSVPDHRAATDTARDAAELEALRQESLRAPGYDRHRCLYNLALALQQSGAADEAQRTYLEALGLPGCPRTVRARCLTNLGAMGLAGAHRVADRDPAAAVAAVAQARAALAEAARLDPGLTAATFNLSAAAALADRVQAQYDLAQALSRNPGTGPRPPPAPGAAETEAVPPAAALSPGLTQGSGPGTLEGLSGTPGGTAASGDVLERLASAAGSSRELLQRLQARRGTALPALRLPW